jgi:hypothetical protein
MKSAPTPSAKARPGRWPPPKGRWVELPAYGLTPESSPAIRLLREAGQAGRLKIHPREIPWLDRMQKAVEAIPASESAFIGDIMGQADTTKFVAADYNL